MLAHVWKVSDNIWHPKKAKTLKQKTQKSKCIQKHGPGIFLVRIRGAGENILNGLVSLCCAHSPCISSLSTIFSSISLYVFCRTSSSLWRQWSLRFPAHLIFSFLSVPSIQLPLLLSSCNEPGSPHSSLPWVCMGAEYTSHLKMTSSFYAAANQTQAHGTLPLWTRYVHKIGRERDAELKTKAKHTAKCSFPLE